MPTQISNPLGTGGRASIPLGNLTAGVEALQRTEIERQLRDLQQQKQYAREDEKWLLGLMPDKVDAIRTNMAERIMKDTDEFTKKCADMAKKAGTEGRTISLKEKMELQNSMMDINKSVGSEKSFINAFSEAQRQHIATYNKLGGEEARTQFKQQWVDLMDKVNDPKTQVGTYDIMLALQPPAPPLSVRINDFIKDVEGVYDVLPGGRVVDENDTVNQLAQRLAANPDLIRDVNQRYGAFNLDDPKAAAENIYSYAQGQLTKSERLPQPRAESDDKDKTGFVTESESIDFSGRSGSAVVLTGKVPSFKIVDDSGRAASFEPIKIMNVLGRPVILGEKTVKANEIATVSEDVYNMLRFQKAKIGNPRKVGDKWEVTYPIDQKVPELLEYSQYKNSLSKQYPELTKSVNALSQTTPPRGVPRQGQPEFPESDSGRTYTINGNSYTEEQLRSAGWSDNDLQRLDQ